MLDLVYVWVLDSPNSVAPFKIFLKLEPAFICDEVDLVLLMLNSSLVKLGMMRWSWGGFVFPQAHMKPDPLCSLVLQTWFSSPIQITQVLEIQMLLVPGVLMGQVVGFI
eukprot:TRINITY_DN39256_c0_g1_i2.p1 TRINITY_DN39256_c0_g1~~TRINITY_DN39256_c0_g1_i2.p1  ORF type:complete len:109 (-),score=3.12 TRINITY_DN39256_c0_g1_i2:968-1294(-)